MSVTPKSSQTPPRSRGARESDSAQNTIEGRTLEWLYQPPGGGMDSSSRHYLGFNQRNAKKLLRPARPVKIELSDGDLLSLENIDGATPVLLLPFSASGKIDAAALGLAGNPIVYRRKRLHGLDTISQWFENQGGKFAAQSGDSVNNTDQVPGIRIFDESTPPNEAFIIKAQRPVTLWMLIDPSMINEAERIHFGGMGGAINYQHTRGGKPANVLPEPFGDIRDEFTVARGTAISYELSAGETVQIIDVDGQQCSDFMAMNARSLDDGLERYIDSTVTRSMIRGAYPIPGLFDKFYDQDMNPLLKLKQDTVGRHDTFALACTARGYEERGFFGHLNCSDNISHAYRRFGIRERSAWPAINFFFNSWIDHTDNLIQSDEAWSRPGDYVAMEAMNDLVAVSTACPDDVDPINGWNPTDIHVRIYRKNTPVRYAVAYINGCRNPLRQQEALRNIMLVVRQSPSRICLLCENLTF